MALEEEHALCSSRDIRRERLAEVERKASEATVSGKGLKDFIREAGKEERVDLLGWVAEGVSSASYAEAHQ